MMRFDVHAAATDRCGNPLRWLLLLGCVALASACSRDDSAVPVVAEIPLQANAGIHQTAEPGETVMLDGRSSRAAPNAPIVEQQWRQTEGVEVTIRDADQLLASFDVPSAAQAGDVFRFSLTVTDDRGRSTSATTQVRVTVEPNQAPVADAGLDLNVVSDADVVLDGSASSDPDGEIVRWHWQQIAGPDVTLDQDDGDALASFRAPVVTQPAVLTFRLIVTDDHGAQAADETRVTVAPLPVGPTADAGADLQAKSGETVTLDGSASSAGDAAIVEWSWALEGAGETSIELVQDADNPQASFIAPDVDLITELTLRLTVTDGNGITDADTVAVAISPRPFVGREIVISPGPNATDDALDAFIDAQPGDMIRFECGFFDINATLLLTQVEAVTIRGCGIDDTVLSFRQSQGTEGLLINAARGIVVEDMTIADAPGNGLEPREVDHMTVRRVRTFWSSDGGASSPNPVSAANYQGSDSPLHVPCTEPAIRDPNAPENALLGGTSSPDYTVSPNTGRYGIFPVRSENVLIEHSESIGASDAGIYVGQSSNVIIRNSRAAFNVFGFEIENVRHGEYNNNLAECNTGGFLIYDLDNLTRYGERTIMRNNISRMNNTYNFASSGLVGDVPAGSGLITLAYDRIDVFGNLFEDNNTAGIIHVSYELFPEGAGRPSDRKIDFYTEGMRVFNNTFRNNGNQIATPNTNDLADLDIARFLPALVGAKIAAGCALNPIACPVDTVGPYRGGHIIWDGLLPEYDPDCPYPVDADGQPVPEEPRVPGKPRFTNEHPQPACRYNAYKFHTDQPGNPRKKPRFFASCIEANNDFSDDSVTFANFNGTRGLEAALILLTDDDPPLGLLNPDALQSIVEGVVDFVADFDMSAHDCDAAYGENLPPIEPVNIPPFLPSGDFEPPPSAEEIAALCEATVPSGEVNFAAAAVNCPDLSQYHLFADPEDPTSDPNDRGFPFVLNTKLFSDYSVKYRVAYLPPGTQAIYSAPGATAPSAGIVFPVGTIIAKTFAFVDGGDENVIETRLLIKRETSSGIRRWNGLPYIWHTDNDGNRIATLQTRGREGIEVSWNFQDVDSGALHQGGTSNYTVPTSNQCLSCHANTDGEAGSAPIGPKVRYLNRRYQSESPVITDQGRHAIAGNNQIAWMCSNDLMTGCPDNLGIDGNTGIAGNLEHVPRFNVPGDGGNPAGSDADIEARTRAWLEINCQHCHNPRGFAASTGYFTDIFRQVDASYGICKTPTATGSVGTGGRSVDIKPMDADGSVVDFRIGPQATQPSARMPPIARSVVDIEAHQLIRNWINNVVVADNERYPDSERCAN